MREKMIEALKAHAQGHIEKHKLNVEVILQKPVGIGEHPQHLEEIDKLFDKIATAQERLEVLEDFREQQKGEE